MYCPASRLSNHVVQSAGIAVRTSTQCDDRVRLNQIESNYWQKLKREVGWTF